MNRVAIRSYYKPNSVRRQTHITWTERFRGKAFGFVGLFLMLILFLALLHVWFRIQVVNLGYAINHQVKLKEDLVQKNKILSFEVAKLRSLKRIEEIAKNSLGMETPKKGQMIFLSQLTQEGKNVDLASLLSQEVREKYLKKDKSTPAGEDKPVHVASAHPLKQMHKREQTQQPVEAQEIVEAQSPSLQKLTHKKSFPATILKRKH